MASIPISPSYAHTPPNGFGLFLLSAAAELQRSSLGPAVPGGDSRANPALPEHPPAFTDLHRHLAVTILQNPFWNDFRLLHHLRKREPAISMEDLRRLKADCRLDNRESVGDILLGRLYSGCGAGLNTRQLSFIMKVYPELRDRDIRAGAPGELLAYECFGGQALPELGRVYTHVFIDLFNGCAFGQLSHRRSITAGLDVLAGQVAPLYAEHGYPLQRIIHSTKNVADIRELDRLQTGRAFSGLRIEWEPTSRTFGHIGRFQKAFLASSLVERAVATGAPFSALEASFGRWLRKYNLGLEAGIL